MPTTKKRVGEAVPRPGEFVNAEARAAPQWRRPCREFRQPLLGALAADQT